MLIESALPGFPTSVNAFSSLLKRCAAAKALPQSRNAHYLLIDNGLACDLHLGRLLLQSYAKCGALEDALALFRSTDQRNAASATSVIQGYAQCGFGIEALQALDQMQNEGHLSSRAVYVCILSAFSGQEYLSKAKQIHAQIVVSPFYADACIGTAIVKMYAALDCLDDARLAFDRMPVRTVVTWTIMMGAYAQLDEATEALQLFSQMVLQPGMELDNVTFVCILPSCSSKPFLAIGQHMHALMIEYGVELSDAVVETAFINMYGKCGSIEDAWKIFTSMPCRNVVSWTAMITGYAQLGKATEALELLDQMCLEGVIPNNVTYVSILTACASQGTLKEGKRVHACMPDRGSESDVYVGTALFNMYGRCGCLQYACEMFNKISKRNVVSWNAMILLYAQHGLGMKALKLFSEMLEKRIIPDKVTFMHLLAACTSLLSLVEGEHTYNSILHHELEGDVMIRTALVCMYAKCGSMQEARTIFDKLEDRDIILWNAMIDVYAEQGLANEGLKLFHQMQQGGVKPDTATFVSLLSACAGSLSLAEGSKVHSCILDGGWESSLNTTSALVSMYGKCGSLQDAWRVFGNLSESNPASWATMIGLYADHGDSEAAFRIFNQMLCMGMIADKVTFATILGACSSKTQLADGKQFHALILMSALESDNVIGSALICMYGKCGSAEAAQKLFDRLPKDNVATWNAMIAVYAQHGCGRMALVLFQQMPDQGVFPDKFTCSSVLVACSRCGMMDEACRCFTSMKLNHGITLVADHFSCVIDLLGRAGQLEEAEKLISGMPFRPTIASCTALLDGCRQQMDVARAERAAKLALELDPENISTYVMLSDMYAAAGRNDDAAQIILTLSEKGLQLPELAIA